MKLPSHEYPNVQRELVESAPEGLARDMLRVGVACAFFAGANTVMQTIAAIVDMDDPAERDSAMIKLAEDVRGLGQTASRIALGELNDTLGRG